MIGIALNPHILSSIQYSLTYGWNNLSMLEFSIETNLINHESRNVVENILRCSKKRLNNSNSSGVSITVNNI